VVAVVNSGVSRDAEVMHLIRCLVFIAAKFNFIVTAGHISGHCTDALSHNRLQQFKHHISQAQTTPAPIPPEMLDLLFYPNPIGGNKAGQSCGHLFSEGAS